MAITVPIVDTEISVSTFGKPVADEVNRLTTVTTTTAWAVLPLQNGAVTFDVTPMYRKVGDMVQLRGSVNCITGSVGAPGFATLPVGFRPPVNYVELSVVIYTGARTPGVILIRNTGVLNIYDVAGSVGLNTQFSITG